MTSEPRANPLIAPREHQQHISEHNRQHQSEYDANEDTMDDADDLEQPPVRDLPSDNHEHGAPDDNNSDDLEYFDPGGVEEHEQREEATREAQLRDLVAILRPGQSESSSESTSCAEDGKDDTDDLPAAAVSRIEAVRVTQAYITEIHSATLDNGNLDKSLLNQLRHPLEEPTNITDPDVRLSLDLFLAMTNASEETYNGCCNAIIHRYPDSHILSHYSVKKLVSEITGVVSVYDDMCINSCHAFTGPFSQLKSCTICGETRYDIVQLASTGKEVPRQQFCTILLGPQLQALRRSRMGAMDMHYLDHKMKEVAEMLDNLQADNDIVYDDILSGGEMQDLADRVKFTSNDTIVSSSLDGAQLYQNKKSDTWLSIWILINLSPNQRYKKKHILPGTIIPGPNRPKIIDSYLFRGVHHLSALQRENGGAGLSMWDALAGKTI